MTDLDQNYDCINSKMTTLKTFHNLFDKKNKIIKNFDYKRSLMKFC